MTPSPLGYLEALCHGRMPFLVAELFWGGGRTTDGLKQGNPNAPSMRETKRKEAP